MNAHNFLTFVQNQYDFGRANAIMSETNLKNCWKQWFTAELVHMCNQSDSPLVAETDVHYPGITQGTAQTDGKSLFLSYHPTKGVEAVTEKRNGSRCDFTMKDGSIADVSQTNYVEIRCANADLFVKNKDLAKFEADIKRIEALKAANPALQMTALFAFYGTFDSKQVENFKVMDNSNRTTYVLDSALEGSTSIARLSHMARAGEPRLCLAAFSV
jgi:hypothetical protein